MGSPTRRCRPPQYYKSSGNRQSVVTQNITSRRRDTTASKLVSVCQHQPFRSPGILPPYNVDGSSRRWRVPPRVPVDRQAIMSG